MMSAEEIRKMFVVNPMDEAKRNAETFHIVAGVQIRDLSVELGEAQSQFIEQNYEDAYDSLARMIEKATRLHSNLEELIERQRHINHLTATERITTNVMDSITAKQG